MPTQGIANRRRRVQCHAPKHELGMDGRNGTLNTLFKTLERPYQILRDYSAATPRLLRHFVWQKIGRYAITPRLLRGYSAGSHIKNQVGMHHALPPGPAREWARVPLAYQNTMDYTNIPF